MFDLRIPSGIFFVIVGLVLVTMGLLAPELRAAMTTANVNLYSGLVMSGFGAALLALARRASGAKRAIISPLKEKP